jgi:hypothetical protein
MLFLFWLSLFIALLKSKVSIYFRTTNVLSGCFKGPSMPMGYFPAYEEILTSCPEKWKV